MSSPSALPGGSAGPPRHARPRLHLVYYALAAFDLLTVSLGLFLIDRIMSIYTDSVAVNQVWADRLSDYADLSELAAAVNAPGNDVFDTRDVDTESARLARTLADFNEKATAVHEDLVNNVAEAKAGELLQAFDAIDAAMVEMVAKANLIFSYFRSDQPQRAGERMAEMDRDYARVNATLAELGRQVRAIQKSHFERQTAAAASLRKFEFAIAALIVLMVTAVTFYGHKLAKRMKETARQREESLSALATSEARVQAILDNTTAVVYLKDGDGRYILINRRFEELFHVTREQVLGRDDHDLFPKETADAFRANDREVLARGSAVEFEEIAPHDDGPHTYISVKFPLHDGDGTPYAVCGISTDITERKQAEEELALHRARLEELVTERTAELEASHEQLRLAERLASIGTLAAGLGHDMNNVLFPVRCRLDVIEAAEPNESVRTELAGVRQSVAYLQQLSDGLRLLALDPDDPRAATGVTHLGAWWDEARPLFLTVLPKHAKLDAEIPGDLPPLAVAPHRVTQALFNLVVNAGEAITEGGSVRIRAEALDDRRFVRVGVTDDGHGMPATVKQRALDPFFTTKKRGLSTGLGLALVHGLVKSAGGSVEIESEPRGGTTVTLTLPAIEQTQSSRLRPESQRAAMVSLTDDRMATLVAALLRSAGFTVDHARGEDPGPARLWVVEPSTAALLAARRFLDGSRCRHVIVIGDGASEWTALGATTIEGPVGLEAIQQAIRAAVACLGETADDRPATPNPVC